jgi:hypothetical protein
MRAGELGGTGAGAQEDFGELRQTLRRIEFVADGLREQCLTNDLGRIADLAVMVIALAQRALKKQAGRTEVELQLLEKLGLALRKALSTERQSVSVMEEIVSTVSRYTGLH